MVLQKSAVEISEVRSAILKKCAVYIFRSAANTYEVRTDLLIQKGSEISEKCALTFQKCTLTDIREVLIFENCTLTSENVYTDNNI